MQLNQKFIVDDPANFKLKALHWANAFKTACYLDSNGFSDRYSAFDVLIAAGAETILETESGSAFEQLSKFLEQHKSFIPGYFSYDLKNETEKLHSNNPDYLQFPQLCFFLPKNLILVKGNEVTVTALNPIEIYDTINNVKLSTEKDSKIKFSGKIKSRFNRREYINTVKQLKWHIQRGDIYEINLCQEFFAENVALDPIYAFKELNKISPTPFSNYFKIDDRYIISATPERFLSKRGNKLISQPIKGTAKRSLIVEEDESSKISLRNNEKELSENVMIVDLVRNDLSKSAKSGTVKVEELFGIYSFKQVHQMISTVVCEVMETLSNAQIISNTFPMGSMTGAPKIEAMKLIEQYERTKRGVYSGALGYFSPDGDFDFNVVIRTLLYNSKTKYLSFQAGSAITIDADAELEYEECLLKAQAINEVLSQ